MDIDNRFQEVFELLENQGIIQSRSKIANEFGYKPQAFTEILKGRSKINPYLIQSFCKKFNISLEWLIFGTGEIFNKDFQIEKYIEEKINEALQKQKAAA